MTTGIIGTALHEVSLFRELPDEELNALARQVVQRRFGRNELIFSQGDPGDGLYVVSQGHVSISRQSADGDELILSVSEPGEYFGELALFDDEPRSASATSIDDAVVLFLSRQAFRAFLEAHPSAVFTCLAVIVRQLRRLTDLADEIALLDVRSRLARRLLHLAEQGVVETGEGSKQQRRTSLRITQQQLASMVGATRESVNKHLNSFVDEGAIRLEHGHIRILDPARLEELSEGLA
jgi:CRP/FNR family transcriptional regulator/CRP/FNR family cyclic AMP-dependent transcriptional regulator